MTSHDHPASPWAGDPRLVEAVESLSLEQLGENLRALTSRVEQSRAFDGGKLWTDPPVQAALGAVYDEITRRLTDRIGSANTVVVEFLGGGTLDAYSTCLTGLLDGRSPAERTADLTRCSYSERVALVREWARLEAPQSDHGLDGTPDPVERVSRALRDGRRDASPTEPGNRAVEDGELQLGVAPGSGAARNGHDRGGPRSR